MKPVFRKEKIEIKNSVNFNRWIFVDANQIEQVFIHLLTNSIFALAEKEKKVITLRAEFK
jgi:C4-dicarboxylate-specific signal transduction histidine kinase